jgi:hypothetical protein
MNEFNDYGGSTDDLRREIAEHQRGTPETPAENAKTLADATLRVKHIMGLRAEDATPDDVAFLRAQIQATLRGGL